MSNETILILDNEFYTQWALKTFLENERYVVIIANTVEKALHSFSEYKIAGLITEYRIDQFCTVETIREVKKNFPELYVMMLTNSDVKENKYEEIIHAGVDDYFVKPFSFTRILLHLRKGLKEHNILLQKNQPFDVPRSEARGLPSTRAQAEGPMVDTERRSLPRPKGGSVAPLKYQFEQELNRIQNRKENEENVPAKNKVLSTLKCRVHLISQNIINEYIRLYSRSIIVMKKGL
jgi:DNA-binding response OmpR family regulator